MMELPQYINCFEEEYIECFYYKKAGCQETCAYAIERNDLGVGAMMRPPGELEQDVNEFDD